MWLQFARGFRFALHKLSTGETPVPPGNWWGGRLRPPDGAYRPPDEYPGETPGLPKTLRLLSHGWRFRETLECVRAGRFGLPRPEPRGAGRRPTFPPGGP